ncbi:isoprenylcysteine carboxylmethyltransferase family protein [bacterium]|nr:isoprenylcysteine carboxylmethyltransferase family protein [bacterium]MBU1652356.1 isoprenylcysteine carboxylmethyltransferase family protein [bacterium]MBU1881327.1 isoprenylcysteine carboxylmethyltransferase family protein [bacterium]
MDLRHWIFKVRSYTPVPFLILLLITAEPSIRAFSIGSGMILLGEILRLWGVAHAGRATRTHFVGATHLVTSGPFALTRNPLYLANGLIYTGVACLAGGQWYWVLIAMIFSILQYNLIVSIEEKTLEELFGFEYAFYRSSVPRWTVRLTPWHWSIPQKPNWQNAWKVDRQTRINIGIILLLFAIKGLI